MRRGLLIALSGVDCAGKSTQRDRLMEALRAQGRRPVNFYTRPGYTPGLRAIKNAVASLTGRKKPERNGISKDPGSFPRRATNLGGPLRRKLWLTAALLDLLWLHCIRIPVSRLCGRSVVCNRHILDCLVDFRVNFPEDRVERRLLWKLLRRFAPRPDASFCFMIPADMTMERSRQKARFHWEPIEVLEERWREYRVLAKEFGTQVLDGTLPMEALADSIASAVADIIPSRELEHSRLP